MAAIPTIAEIARQAGVSTYTASLALRNSTRVAAATRDHVRQIAESLGYRPNPLINALMARVRNRRGQPTGDVLGFVISREHAIHPGQLDHQSRFFNGASARARDLGFRIEKFPLSSVEGRGQRLQQILDARGIHGVLIAPVPDRDFRIDLAWDRLAAATIGYSFSEVPIHRASHNHFRSMGLVLDTCHARGWTRPGLIISQHVLEAVDQGFLAGYLTGTYRRNQRVPIPPLLYRDDAFGSDQLLAWIRKHRVDAVLSLRHDTREWLVSAGYALGRDLGLVMLDCNESADEMAGIDQRQPALGAAATEMLASAMQNSEFGIPRLPRVIGLDGIWHEGPTLPLRAKEKRPRAL